MHCFGRRMVAARHPFNFVCAIDPGASVSLGLPDLVREAVEMPPFQVRSTAVALASIQ